MASVECMPIIGGPAPRRQSRKVAIRWGGQLVHVFVAQGLALVAYGLFIASVLSGGAWFGRPGWPRSTGALLRRLA